MKSTWALFVLICAGLHSNANAQERPPSSNHPGTGSTSVAGQGTQSSSRTNKTIVVITLKSGRVFKGTVLETVPNKYIRIKTLEGEEKSFKLSAVVKIVKETIPAEGEIPRHQVQAPAALPRAVPVSSSFNGFSVRGEIGTDLSLGLFFAVGGAYTWISPSLDGAVELGLDVYSDNSTKSYTADRGVTVTGEDKTSVTIFALVANELFNYSPSRKNIYFIVGTGLLVATVHWEENENAPNWPSPNHYQADGTSFGNIFEFGIGAPLAPGLDARFELPLFVFYSSTGNTSTIALGATLGLTYRFR